MSEAESAKNVPSEGKLQQHPASRLVANLAMVTGGAWIAFVVGAQVFQYLIRPIVEGVATANGIFVGVLWVVGSVIYLWPGAMALLNGLALSRSVSVETVRGAVGAMTFFVVAACSIGLVFFVNRPGAYNLVLTQAMILGIAALGLPAYVMLCRAILVHDEIPFRGFGDIVSQTALSLGAVLVMWATVNAFLIVIPMPITLEPLVYTIYVIGFLVTTIGSGLCFYHFGCRILGHKPNYRRYVFGD